MRPPWINKFYILDLRPRNSFIRWAVGQGHTVFVVSWVNPDERLARKTFEDYMREGPLAALDAIEQATGERNANVIGYCLGGTLLAATLAYMAAKRDNPPSPAWIALHPNGRYLYAGNEVEDGFVSAFNAFIADEHEKLERERKSAAVVEGEVGYWPRSYVAMEGLGLLKLAELLGLQVPEQFPLCPALARLPFKDESEIDLFVELEKYPD